MLSFVCVYTTETPCLYRHLHMFPKIVLKTGFEMDLKFKPAVAVVVGGGGGDLAVAQARLPIRPRPLPAGGNSNTPHRGPWRLGGAGWDNRGCEWRYGPRARAG